jgi:hypothetical protein
MISNTEFYVDQCDLYINVSPVLILIISYLLLFRVQDDDLEEEDSTVHVIKNYSKSTSKKVSDETRICFKAKVLSRVLRTMRRRRRRIIIIRYWILEDKPLITGTRFS